ncbi:hypothetical protein [Candidatus Azobacteroides pseudotrichonymphae]|nr:hypothetical protein [Candidatus Azobacteroides pseudotrichonymphae]
MKEQERITEIIGGVKQERHIVNSKCRSCANFRVNECLIDFITNKH